MPALSGFTVALGDLALRFESGDGAARAALLPRYGEFESSDEPEVRIEWRIRPDRGSGAADPGLAARLLAEPVAIDLDGSRLELRSPSVRAEVDLGRGRGVLAAPAHRHGADLLCRALLAALRPRALLVHAALAIDGGRAFVCAGPSGVGKSTLAALLGERARCDELVRLDREGGGFRAASLPFWHGRPGNAPLAAIRLLRQGERHARTAVPRRQAIRRLAAEVVWPSFSPERAAIALDELGRLVDRVPVDELAFRPTPEVWPYLAGAAA